MDRINPRVNSFVDFDGRRIADANQLTVFGEQATATAAINRPTEDVVLDLAVILGEVLDCRVPNGGWFPVVTTNTE